MGGERFVSIRDHFESAEHGKDPKAGEGAGFGGLSLVSQLGLQVPPSLQKHRRRERGQPGVGSEGRGSCSTVLAPALAACVVPGEGRVRRPLIVGPGLGTSPFLYIQGLKSQGHSVFTYCC